MIRQQKAAPNHIVDYYYKLKKQPIPKKDKVATVLHEQAVEMYLFHDRKQYNVRLLARGL